MRFFGDDPRRSLGDETPLESRSAFYRHVAVAGVLDHSASAAPARTAYRKDLPFSCLR